MSDRVCITRRLRQARAPPAVAAAPAPAAPFRGTVHLADLEFRGPGGSQAVPPADLAAVQAYLGKAVPLVSRYARQYGPAAVTLGPPLGRRTVTVAASGYTDRDLQGWVDAMARDAGLPPGSAIVVLNPTGVVNQDAREQGGVGVLGYHGMATIPYSFVNLLGTGFTLDDPADRYAEAVSHEVAEMTVDPRADGSSPEVCDGCGTNCQGRSAFRVYFDGQGRYLGASRSFPPGFPYAFFLSAIAQPSVASDCPAPSAGCAYPPPP